MIQITKKIYSYENGLLSTNIINCDKKCCAYYDEQKRLLYPDEKITILFDFTDILCFDISDKDFKEIYYVEEI